MMNLMTHIDMITVNVAIDGDVYAACATGFDTSGVHRCATVSGGTLYDVITGAVATLKRQL